MAHHAVQGEAMSALPRGETPQRLAYPGLPAEREHQCLDHWTHKPRTVDGTPAIVRRGNTWYCRWHHRTEAIIPDVGRPTWSDAARTKAQIERRKECQRRYVKARAAKRQTWYWKHRDEILALRRAEREGGK